MPAVLKKILLSLGALFVGPVLVFLIDPFFGMSMTTALVIMAIVFVVAVHRVWRKPKPEEQSSRIWLFIRRSWRGEMKLWKIFWIVGIGASVLLREAYNLDSKLDPPNIWWIVLLLVSLIPLQIWWVVSVWRCAGNTNMRLWSTSAKVFSMGSVAYCAYLYFLILEDKYIPMY